MRIEPFRLERYFARYEFSAPFPMCSSDCESMSVAELLALEPGAGDSFGRLWLGYTESTGHPALREGIATLYDGIAPDEILVHAGAQEAIFNFFQVAVGPSDHVVVHGPCYQSLAEVPRSLGAEVSEWRGDPARGWALDLGALEALLTPRTRVVVVNFPHNPTGFLPDHAFIQALSALSNRHGFLLFSDEVYRGLEHDPTDRLPAMADINDRAVSLGVLSKTYGLAGLRIGWVATRNRGVLSDMAAFKDYTTICSSAPSEFLATLALRHADAIAGRNLGIVTANLSLLDAFFARHEDRFTWHRPNAGPIAFPTLRSGDAETFCADAVERAGVLLLPGSVYGPGLRAFRVGFGRQTMPECLAHLETYLAGQPRC